MTATENSEFHARHHATEEDHIDPGDRDELDSQKRPWVVLLYITVVVLIVMFVWMIARS